MKYIPSIKRAAYFGIVAGMVAIWGIPGLTKVKSQQTTPYTVEHRVRLNGQTANDWTSTANVKPGDKLEWTVKFRNLDTTQLQNIAVSDDLAAGVTVVPGSIMVYDGNYPNGQQVADGAIQADGRKLAFNIGNHNPLPQADQDAGKVSVQVIFATTVDPIAKDACGLTTLTSKATIAPKDREAVTDTAQAVVDTGVPCQQPTAPAPVTPPAAQPETATYSCKLQITPVAAKPRTVRVGVTTSASEGVSVKSYSYDFGDDKTPPLTDQSTQEYTYAKDGTYTVRVKTTFVIVTDQTKTVADKECVQSVEVKMPAQATSSTSTTVPSEQPQLPNTGAADVAVLFAATTIAGAIAHWIYVSRRYGL